jgi:hypothetical protein
LRHLPNVLFARLSRDTRFAPVRPVIPALIVDDGGNIWVGEHDPAREMEDGLGSGWDVVSGEGQALRRVRFPKGFRLMRVRDGRAYGVATTEDGVQVVQAYRVNGK